MSLKCFLVKETSWCLLYARRYSMSDTCSAVGRSYHNAMVKIGYFPVEKTICGTHEYNALPDKFKIPKDSTTWPTKCDHCDYVFVEEDSKQDFYEVMYTKVDSEDEDVSDILLSSDGETPYQERVIGIARTWWPRRDLPPGAMYRCPWNRDFWWTNETEDPVYVMCPGGTEWNIDSRANNCALPQDTTHRCWKRTGTIPNITVTSGCPAGGGSIQTPNYHGMLQEGEFRTCGDSKIQV